MSRSAEVLVIRSGEVELAELAVLSRIQTPGCFQLDATGWRPVAASAREHLRRITGSPFLVVGKRAALRLPALPVLSSGTNSIRQIREFVRSLPEISPCLLSWGIPGAYDFLWRVASGLSVPEQLAASLVRRTRLDEAWTLQGAVSLDSIGLFQTLWRRSAEEKRIFPHVVAMEGAAAGIAERSRGRLIKQETLLGGGRTVWERFECRSLEIGTDLIRPNRGGAFVSVWPPWSDSAVIERILSTWVPGIGLGFPAAHLELEPGLWCALFGAGTEDQAMTCFCGDLEATLGEDFEVHAGF